MVSPISVAVIGFHQYTPYLVSTLSDNPKLEVSVLIAKTEDTVDGSCPQEVADMADSSLIIAESINTEEIRTLLRENSISLGICLGWYEIIEESVLTTPEYGIIGVHAAPLPEGRGQAPVNYQIIYGKDGATVSVFQLTPAVDAGDLYGQCSVPIFEAEDVESLYDRLLYRAVSTLNDVISAIAEGRLETQPQSIERATYWPERRPADSLIHWDSSATQLSRLVRALSGPYPSAHTYVDQRKLRITQATPHPDIEGTHQPGEIIRIDSAETLLVQTGSGALGIQRAGFPGEPELGAGELASEIGVGQGDSLGADTDYPHGFIYLGLRGPEGKLDLELETNVEKGSPARNYLYCLTPNTTQHVSIEVSADQTIVDKQSITVDGQTEVPIEYTPTEYGETLIEVAFPDLSIDSRKFIVYARE